MPLEQQAPAERYQPPEAGTQEQEPHWLGRSCPCYWNVGYRIRTRSRIMEFDFKPGITNYGSIGRLVAQQWAG